LRNPDGFKLAFSRINDLWLTNPNQWPPLAKKQ
jgi:hypothetical protein